MRLIGMSVILLKLFFLMTLLGCKVLQYSQQLTTLKNVGESQAQIQEFVDLQEERFDRLLSDVRDQRIPQGADRNEIISTYGEPIVEDVLEGDDSIVLRLLYRHPTHFFSSDRVYLFFNHSDKLAYWEYVPE